MPLCSYMIMGISAVGERIWVISGKGWEIVGEKS